MWFWFWLAFLLIFLIIPLGWGWGYRGWGAPYPSVYRRRGTVRTSPDREETLRRQGAPAEREGGWGFWADVLWIFVLVAVAWLVIALVF